MRVEIYLDGEGTIQLIAPLPTAQTATMFGRAIPEGGPLEGLKRLELDLPDDLSARLLGASRVEDADAVMRAVKQLVALRPDLPPLALDL